MCVVLRLLVFCSIENCRSARLLSIIFMGYLQYPLLLVCWLGSKSCVVSFVLSDTDVTPCRTNNVHTYYEWCMGEIRAWLFQLKRCCRDHDVASPAISDPIIIVIRLEIA